MKSKVLEKDIPHINEKKVGGAILTSDKADFRMRNITKNKVGYGMIQKGSFLQEDITIPNV